MDVTERYLQLLKNTLTNELYVELEAQLLTAVMCAARSRPLTLEDFWQARGNSDVLQALRQAKHDGDSVILEVDLPDGRRYADENLRNYTEYAYTLVGRKRLDHLQACIDSVIEEGIPGDLLEAGVWRGGCSILMRGVLAARGCKDRTVWLCDSFQGMPASVAAADAAYAMDVSRYPFLAVSEESVRENLRRFDLLDDQVQFLPGWFSDTLPTAPPEQLALLRVDADLYQSTMDVLTHLYSRVSPGGWVIIDDYHMLPPCREAVDGFRDQKGILTPLVEIDDHAACWQVPN